MVESLYTTITTLAECEVLIKTAQTERDENEARRLTLNVRLSRRSDTKQNQAANLARAQADLAAAQQSLTTLEEGTLEWRKMEAQRRKADANVYDLLVEAEETVESIRLEVGHQLEVLEAVVAIKNDHLTKLLARKAALGG